MYDPVHSLTVFKSNRTGTAKWALSNRTHRQNGQESESVASGCWRHPSVWNPESFPPPAKPVPLSSPLSPFPSLRGDTTGSLAAQAQHHVPSFASSVPLTSHIQSQHLFLEITSLIWPLFTSNVPILFSAQTTAVHAKLGSFFRFCSTQSSKRIFLSY